MLTRRICALLLIVICSLATTGCKEDLFKTDEIDAWLRMEQGRAYDWLPAGVKKRDLHKLLDKEMADTGVTYRAYISGVMAEEDLFQKCIVTSYLSGPVILNTFGGPLKHYVTGIQAGAEVSITGLSGYLSHYGLAATSYVGAGLGIISYAHSINHARIVITRVKEKQWVSAFSSYLAYRMNLGWDDHSAGWNKSTREAVAISYTGKGDKEKYVEATGAYFDRLFQTYSGGIDQNGSPTLSGEFRSNLRTAIKNILLRELTGERQYLGHVVVIDPLEPVEPGSHRPLEPIKTVGLEEYLGWNKADIIGLFGEPDSSGTIMGSEYITYEDEKLHFLQPLGGDITTAIISGKENREILGIRVGMTFAEIKGILGPPIYEGEYYEGGYMIVFQLAEVKEGVSDVELSFFAEEPDAPSGSFSLNWKGY